MRNPASVEKNLPYIAEFGRFDDLLALFDTPCEGAVKRYIAECFREDMKQLQTEDAPVSLLAKWLPSPNASSKETVALAKKVRSALCLSEAEYRRALSALRKRIDVLENHLREREYSFKYFIIQVIAVLVGIVLTGLVEGIAHPGSTHVLNGGDARNCASNVLGFQNHILGGIDKILIHRHLVIIGI